MLRNPPAQFKRFPGIGEISGEELVRRRGH
jgi:hypothetical protein